MRVPETRYTKTSDGVYLAYQVTGGGSVDVVYEPGWASNVDLMWARPDIGRFLRHVATWARLIVFDRRGSGLSDRTAGIPSLETRTDDLRSVMDAAGSERAVIVGLWDGGNTAALFASSHPDRALGIVLVETRARNLWATDYPIGEPVEENEEYNRQAEAGWGTGGFESWWVSESPEKDDQAYIDELAYYFRHCISPGGALLANEMWARIDIRGILPAIHVPTLVIDGHADPVHARYLAEHIAGARLAHNPRGTQSSEYFPGPGTEREAEQVRSFVEDLREERAQLDRVLATVLFTDIVGSTERAAELGDRGWGALLGRHHQRVRALLARYRGVEVDTAGDGFFATFDGPARAVRCAHGIVEAVRTLGLEVRAGIHVGEVQTVDDKAGGLAVMLGARLGAMAAPSEVLVSGTVSDLCVGSGLAFEEVGQRELKGIPGTWRVLRAVA